VHVRAVVTDLADHLALAHVRPRRDAERRDAAAREVEVRALLPVVVLDDDEVRGVVAESPVAHVALRVVGVGVDDGADRAALHREDLAPAG
jgi:hypothetical protein